MRRAVATSLVSLLAVATFACGPAPLPLTDVTVSWEFDRITFIDGVEGFITYDCRQAGVDFVTISDGFNNLIANAVPCLNGGFQGAVVGALPGPNTFVVTGWRNNINQPLFTGERTINVLEGFPNVVLVVAQGIPDLLTVDAILADFPGGPAYTTCGLAGIQRFDGWIVDGNGRLIWRNPVLCGPSQAPGISFGWVDRDNLFLWMDAWDLRVNPPDLHWSICASRQPHFFGVENRFSLRLPLGVCAPAPP